MKALLAVLFLQAFFVGLLCFIALCLDAHYQSVRHTMAARRKAREGATAMPAVL
jgi:hypothetical protein